MSATLDQVIENSDIPQNKTESWAINSPSSSIRPLAGAEIQTATDPTQHDFGDTMTQNGNNDCLHASSSFTDFVDRFDSLRIPFSPLNEY